MESGGGGKGKAGSKGTVASPLHLWTVAFRLQVRENSQGQHVHTSGGNCHEDKLRDSMH